MVQETAGLTSWSKLSNNNRMLEFQTTQGSPDEIGDVELAFFGSSAFRITTPLGMTLLIDPWRNPPSGGAQWYRQDFPEVAVDIGISTHAHFDHDALHRLDANMLLDRPIGRFELADVRIIGIADKHVTDIPSACPVDWSAVYRQRTGIDNRPPENPRAFDNALVIVETGGIRILHWGDNRADPPEHIWAALGKVDVVLLPVDESRHLLSYRQVDRIAERLGAQIIVPCHYLTPQFMHHDSTLLPADDYVRTRDVEATGAPTILLKSNSLLKRNAKILHFGNCTMIPT